MRIGFSSKTQKTCDALVVLMIAAAKEINVDAARAAVWSQKRSISFFTFRRRRITPLHRFIVTMETFATAAKVAARSFRIPLMETSYKLKGL